MAFQHWHGRAVSRPRSGRECRALGILVLLSLWAFEKPPASHLPPSTSHRRLPNEASRVERATGNRRLPKPPPVTVEPGAASLRQLPKPPPVEPGVRKRRLPSPPPVGRRGTAAKGELPAAADSIAAMIDGETASPESVVEFLADLRQHGRVVERRLFTAQPRRVESVGWKSVIDSNSIEVIPVPISTGPSRDQKKDVVLRQVRELLQSRRIGAIALLVMDKRLAPLVTETVSAGRRCFVKLLRPGPGKAGPFERAGAQILSSSDLADSPKYICTLHGDGTGSMQMMSDALSLPRGALELQEDDLHLIKSQLGELGYRSSSGDPLIPSIAKFWFNNGLGDLTVFPGNHAAMCMSRIFRERQRAEWVPGRKDLAVIFPYCKVRKLTKLAQEEYGSATCASYVKAGVGPFILQDSSSMVEELLRKLGFVDDYHNACFREGLDVFANLAKNARAMRRSVVQISDLDTTREKAEKIRQLCLSDSFSGELHVPVNDVDVRRYLFANSLLKNQYAPADEVFFAMESLLSSAHVVPKRTYNGRVVQCLDIYAGRKRHA